MAITQADPKRGLQTGGLQTGGLQTGSLQTGAASAEKQLLSLGGLGDSFKAGGFAEKDMVRQSIREGLAQDNRLKRAANLAYREAVRSGDRLGALNILLGARKEGIAFGGIQAAGRDRERVIQERGEDLITAMKLRGQPAGQEAGKSDLFSNFIIGDGANQKRALEPTEYDPLMEKGQPAQPSRAEMFSRSSPPAMDVAGREGAAGRVNPNLPRDKRVSQLFKNMFPKAMS